MALIPDSVKDYQNQWMAMKEKYKKKYTPVEIVAIEFKVEKGYATSFKSESGEQTEDFTTETAADSMYF